MVRAARASGFGAVGMYTFTYIHLLGTYDGHAYTYIHRTHYVTPTHKKIDSLAARGHRIALDTVRVGA